MLIAGIFLRVFGIIAAILGVVAVILVFDILMAYRAHRVTLKQLTSEASRNGLSAQELKEILRETRHGPRGTTGLARTLMALMILAILGVSVVYLLFNGPRPGDSEIVKTVLTILSGAITSIVGFYFGARTAETSAQAASEPETQTSSRSS